MPFVRFSRDKRGYEYVYLMDVPGRQSKGTHPRVLYWFRTPPGLKVGREPFDKAAQQALEARYPELTFDWKQITETPKPPPDAGAPWRERRRLERAAKRARAVEETREGGEAAEDEVHEDALADATSHGDEGSIQSNDRIDEFTGPPDEWTAPTAEGDNAGLSAAPVVEAPQAATGGAVPAPNDAASKPRRRRRRRGGRGRRRGEAPPADAGMATAGTPAPAEAVADGASDLADAHDDVDGGNDAAGDDGFDPNTKD